MSISTYPACTDLMAKSPFKSVPPVTPTTLIRLTRADFAWHSRNNVQYPETDKTVSGKYVYANDIYIFSMNTCNNDVIETA